MMMRRLLLLGALLAGLAAPAAGQLGLHLSFGKHKHHRGFHISANLGLPVVHTHRSPRVARGYGRGYRRGYRRGVSGGFRGVPALRGHYRYVDERVWVPGCRRRVFVPARYGYRYDSCGRRVRYCISQACYRYVEEPGRWEYQRRRVWVGY